MDDDLDFLEEEQEEYEGEGWLTSYSDLVTDLMAVFVLLLSFAMVTQAYRNVSTEEKLSGGSTEMVESVDMSSTIEEARNQLAEKIREYIEENGLSTQIDVVEEGQDAIVLRISDRVFFESGQSDIEPESEEVLDRIKEMLLEYIYYIDFVQIEGHTDNRPISNQWFSSNWELSADRAVKVLRHLLGEAEFDQDKFAATGYGEYHPIEDNDSSEGREKNRRVDFIIRPNGILIME